MAKEDRTNDNAKANKQPAFSEAEVADMLLLRAHNKHKEGAIRRFLSR